LLRALEKGRFDPARKLRHWLLGIIVLAMLAPGVGWSQVTDTGSTGNDMNLGGAGQSGRHGDKSDRHSDKKDQPNDQHGEQNDQHDATGPQHHKSGAAHTPTLNSASRSSFKVGHRTVATEPRVGAKAFAPRGGTSNHLAGVPRFIPNGASPTIAAGVSGNAVARHTPVKTAVGGPTTSDPKNAALVVIGGASMIRGPHSRPGDYQ